MSETPTPDLVPGPDRRALWLSIGGGSLTGLMFCWGYVQSVVTGQPLDRGVNALGNGVEYLLGDLLLPILLALLPRRRPFLWAVLGISLNVLWSASDRVVALNVPGLLWDLRVNGLGALYPLLLISGPLCLVRYLRRRHRERIAGAALAQREAWDDTAIQGNVWPPAPNRPQL